MSDPVKVYLFHVEPGDRPLFFAEPPEDDDPSKPLTHNGIRGWFEAKLRHFKTAVLHSENRAARLSRYVWERLQRTTHPDEALLSRLRSTQSVDIHHSSTLSRDEALAAWAAFLGKSRRRHWPWFLVNLIVSPLTLILGPLPGPNLIGYWIAYRAVHHWLILLGLNHARKGAIETQFRAIDSLDKSRPAREDMRPEFDHEALEEFLRRHGVTERQPNLSADVADNHK